MAVEDSQVSPDGNPPASSRNDEEQVSSPGRSLVICLDGTGDEFDERNTNVVTFFSLLTKGKPGQLVYYQAGIGTYTVPEIATHTTAKQKMRQDKAFGFTLRHHVMDAYKFLMENYKHGDKICIFGFSRGAHTARALAGMIAKVGLLPAGNHQQVPFAYKMYANTDERGWKQSMLFKKTFSMDIMVEFVGVWDTVDSTVSEPRRLPFVRYNPCIKTFRHAVALDERRVKFKPYCHDTEGQKDEARYNERARCEIRTDTALRDEKAMHVPTTTTDVLEVWFAGCHSDVGGGSVVNATRFSLARIPLRWMIRQCYLTKSGIQFDEERLHIIGYDSKRKRIDNDGLPVDLVPLSATDREVEARLEADKKPTERGYDEWQKWRIRLSDDDAKIKCKKCDSIVLRTEKHIADHQGGMSCMYEAEVQVDEEHEELHDALSPMYDQLSRKGKRYVFWRIVEVFSSIKSIKIKRPIANNGRRRIPRITIGNPRTLPESLKKGNRFKVHRTVKTRIEAVRALDAPYKFRLDHGSMKPIYVD